MKKNNYIEIKKTINNANNILLTLHNHPDADSFGSNLALFHYLRSIKKKVTLISGDSELKSKNTFFPGYDKITEKNISEVRMSDYDLFIICDALYEQVSYKYIVETLVKNTKIVLFDHHPRSTIKAVAQLYDVSATSTSELVYDYLTNIKFKLTKNISICLMLGILEDTGGFENLNSNAKGVLAFANIVKNIPDFSRIIFEYKNNSLPGEIDFIKLALDNYKMYISGKVAISTISYKDLQESNISSDCVQKTYMSQFLRRCSAWKITASIVEKEEGVSGISIRSRGDQYDVSLVAQVLGGGGHKVAAGATVQSDAHSALTKLLDAIKQTIPNL